MSDIIDNLPNITGGQAQKRKPSLSHASISNINFDNIQSSFGIALHMHQPTIPASSEDLTSASLISNLQHMLEHPNIGDNHNASVFLRCYSRMSDIIPSLVEQGKNPRVMLDYSGNLL
ncbi:MAG: glycosyl hydrolase family 57, partial [Candidatus Omnitrophica bacterium]|nr:glycosyl hydrolase family 57 [Candidatus Omnitrophota bacterium]